MRPRTAALAVLLAALPLYGFTCGTDESREDAHDVVHVDKTPPEVLTFNNHYPNVETKCLHGWRVFATTDEHGNGVAIYPDPSCPGWTEQMPKVLVGR